MTNREKIILGLTATAAAIGVAVHFAVPPSGEQSSTEDERTDFNALIVEVRTNVQQGELTEREERALEAVATQWLRDPLRPRPLVSPGTGRTDEIPLPMYMGFINTGPRPIAIIDGHDYRAGESVRGGEFQVLRVFPDEVELLRRGASDPVKVPLENSMQNGSMR